MRDLKILTGHRVVVSADGSVLRGVLESATRRFVTLIDVDDVERGEPKPVKGTVLVPVSRVRYVQVVV